MSPFIVALLLSAGPGPANTKPAPADKRDVTLLNTDNLKLEFEALDVGHSGVGSVEVYETTDEGKNWTRVAPLGVVLPPTMVGGPPQVGSVELAAPREGVVHGYIIVVKNKLGGGQGPPKPGTRPQARAETDRTAPEALLYRLRPDPADRGRMLLRWKASDRNLGANPITLEWAAKPDGPWTFIGGPKLPNTGRYAWTVSTSVPAQVYLKMTVRDRAGNASIARTAAPIAVDLSMPRVGKVRAVASERVRPGPKVSVDVTGPEEIPLPPPGPVQVARKGQDAEGDPKPAGGPLPPVLVVKSRKAKVLFDVREIGRSKVGKVEVYLTADEGGNWEEVKPEAIQFPKDKARGKSLVGLAVVKVPKEGVVYGYYVVVKNRIGLGGPAPTPGTSPHVRVEADSTPPEAILRMPRPDPKRKDLMVFDWTATDRNLANNPITLEWSEKPDGPWKLIGEPELPNTGNYPWKVPEGVPAAVYLKMTVRDRAGNVSTAKTPRPIPMELDVPKLGEVRVVPAE